MINDDDEIIEIPRSRLQELGEAIRLLGDLLDEERKSHEDIVASMRETVNSVFAKNHEHTQEEQTEMDNAEAADDPS